MCQRTLQGHGDSSTVYTRMPTRLYALFEPGGNPNVYGGENNSAQKSGLMRDSMCGFVCLSQKLDGFREQMMQNRKLGKSNLEVRPSGWVAWG